MSEATTMARPYAQAVFELANEGKALKEWSELLAIYSSAVNDPQVAKLIGNPSVSEEQLSALLMDMAGDKGSKELENFLKLLISNARLIFMPEIVALYEKYRAETENTVEAEVVSAFKTTKAQQTQIASALKKRLGRNVTLNCSTDKSLIGGLVIRAGDTVIDGSVKGQLERMSTSLLRKA